MSERINIPFTNEHFVAFCEKMLGQPYWYGAVVYKCTESLRARKAKQYQLADEIRDKLGDIGIVIEDTPTGARW